MHLTNPPRLHNIKNIPQNTRRHVTRLITVYAHAPVGEARAQVIDAFIIMAGFCARCTGNIICPLNTVYMWLRDEDAASYVL